MKMQKCMEVLAEEMIISADGKEIYGRLYRPEKKEKCPILIMSHGYNGTYSDFSHEGTYLAENGIAAFVYDFCGGSVNSQSSGETTEMTIFTEKEDLTAVLDYIRILDFVDADNIFLFGGSQGGLVTALTAAENVDLVQGMVLMFPALCIPDNWRDTYPEIKDIPEILEFWGMSLGAYYFLSIHDFDPYEVIGDYDKNVLILHGTEDTIVPMSYAERAQQTYQNAELVIFEGEGHGFSEEGRKKEEKLTLEFIQENLSK